MKPRALLLILFFGSVYSSIAQKVKVGDKDKNLTFVGTEVVKSDAEYDSTGQIILSGYISNYFAHYNDSVGIGDYQKFPTVSPYSDRFGLNIVQFGGHYNSNSFRGTFTLQWGDIPKSAWSPQYNFIQEANGGFRIAKGLWFDLGYFRTHIGLESIQPRENIAMSIATTTYFEPYFLSGAKLTYKVNDVLALQANVFNSFNTFIETNKNLAAGLSAVVTPNDNLTVTINTTTSDESDIYLNRPQQRLYNNIYGVYRSNKIDVGTEYNFGIQQNTKLTDSLSTAYMQSMLLAVKYKITSKLALYTRGEYFSDPNEILTGPVENSKHEIIGLDFTGVTLGVEYKPIPNSYIRLEGRSLHTKKNEDIFIVNGAPTNHREEIIIGVGVWF